MEQSGQLLIAMGQQLQAVAICCGTHSAISTGRLKEAGCGVMTQ